MAKTTPEQNKAIVLEARRLRCQEGQDRNPQVVHWPMSKPTSFFLLFSTAPDRSSSPLTSHHHLLTPAIRFP